MLQRRLRLLDCGAGSRQLLLAGLLELLLELFQPRDFGRQLRGTLVRVRGVEPLFQSLFDF